MVINNLSFKFDTTSKHYFFKDLTVNFHPNSVNFIQGENGIGKSTLFSILQNSFDSKAPSLEGSVVLDGIAHTASHHKFPETLTRRVHLVQQNYSQMLASQFTFMENLQFANLPKYPGLHPLPQATMFECMHPMKIEPDTPVCLLSGGQQQLLAILMALQKPTRLMLLDEPTATLDQKNSHLIMQTLQHVATQLKVTILVICHDKTLIDRYGETNCFTMRQLNDGTRILTKTEIRAPAKTL